MAGQTVISGELSKAHFHRVAVHPDDGTQKFIQAGSCLWIELFQRPDINIGVLDQHQLRQFIQLVLRDWLAVADFLQNRVLLEQRLQRP